MLGRQHQGGILIPGAFQMTRHLSTLLHLPTQDASPNAEPAAHQLCARSTIEAIESGARATQLAMVRQYLSDHADTAIKVVLYGSQSTALSSQLDNMHVAHPYLVFDVIQSLLSTTP